MITIYSKPNCPQCDEAKTLVKNYEHEVIMLGESITRDELLAKFPDARMMPIIVKNGNRITLKDLRCQS